MLPHSPGKGRALVILTRSGLRAGISLGQQLQCLGREQRERRARARERRVRVPSHCWCSPALAFLLG